MLVDTKQIGGAADTEVSQFRERSSLAKLDIELCESGDDFGIANAHGAPDAPFRAGPSARCSRG